MGLHRIESTGQADDHLAPDLPPGDPAAAGRQQERPENERAAPQLLAADATRWMKRDWELRERRDPLTTPPGAPIGMDDEWDSDWEW